MDPRLGFSDATSGGCWPDGLERDVGKLDEVTVAEARVAIEKTSECRPRTAVFGITGLNTVIGYTVQMIRN